MTAMLFVSFETLANKTLAHALSSWHEIWEYINSHSITLQKLFLLSDTPFFVKHHWDHFNIVQHTFLFCQQEQMQS